MGKLFDGKLVFTQIPLLLKYLPVTMELAVTAMIASLILGLLLALVKIKKVPVLKQLVSIYISVIRGTPILVQLYVTYFGIPMLLKYINFKCGTNYNVNGVAPIVYAFVALALNESAFNAEIIRASLESVDKGQVEAASALGMNYPGIDKDHPSGGNRGSTPIPWKCIYRTDQRNFSCICLFRSGDDCRRKDSCGKKLPLL